MPNTRNMKSMFSWLTRVGIGMRFPGTPIGWYQSHQICAIDNIEHRAKKKLGLETQGYEVKASGGDVMARPGGARKGTRFAKIGTVNEFYRNADDCARGDKDAAFRGPARRRRKRRR
jgi:hypothetical protein